MHQPLAAAGGKPPRGGGLRLAVVAGVVDVSIRAPRFLLPAQSLAVSEDALFQVSSVSFRCGFPACYDEEPLRPAFELRKVGKILFGIDLIPGHGRWQINLQKMFREHGAPLREATDVLIARVSDDGKTEMVVAALEFCSALPAGNNAWQRNGRALVCAVVGMCSKPERDSPIEK